MRTQILLLTLAVCFPASARAQAPVSPTPSNKSTSPRAVSPVAPLKVGVSGLLGYQGLTQPEPKVDLNLENATVREALKQVFEQAHQEYLIDEAVPDEPRVTARVKDVRLSTALGIILQNAGAGTHLSLKDGKSTVRIFKQRAGATGGSGLLPNILNFDFPLGPDGTVQLPGNLSETARKFLQQHPDLNLNAAVPYVLNLQEQRSTFRCPHCKGQSTVIRKADQPKCEKCQRPFQPDWQFCPADGAKRPASASEWRFCPFCGKRVMDDKSSGVPFLSDLPVVGNLFRITPPADSVLAVPAVPRADTAPRVAPVPTPAPAAPQR